MCSHDHGWHIVGSSSRDCTNVSVSPKTRDLLKIVRAQKQQHRLISTDPIFQQYTKEVKHHEAELRRHGWKSVERPNVDDDLDTEAHYRLMALISCAGKKRDQETCGVFAPFGKPYSVHGTLVQVIDKLPELTTGATTKSSLDGKAKIPWQQRKVCHAKQQLNFNAQPSILAAGQDPANDETILEDRLLKRQSVLQFSTPERHEASFPQGQLVSAKHRRAASQAVTPWLHPVTANTEQLASADYEETTLTTPIKDMAHTVRAREENRLEQALSPRRIHSREMKKLELSFPKNGAKGCQEPPLQYVSRAAQLSHLQFGVISESEPVERVLDDRQLYRCSMHQSMMGSLLRVPGANQALEQGSSNMVQAKAPCWETNQRPAVNDTKIQKQTACGRDSECSEKGSSVSFLHKVGSSSTSARQEFSGAASSGRVMPTEPTVSRVASSLSDVSHAASVEELAVGAMPTWQFLTKPIRIPFQEGANPVFTWHQEYLNIRQLGRQKTQEVLRRRVQGRFRARTDSALSLGFYKAVMSELDYHMGKRPAHVHLNVEPRDPYDRAQLFVDNKRNEEPQPKQYSTGLQMEDVHVLERFYEQLCLLVEAQKASDPMSLFIVQLVKDNLEGGSTLHLPLVLSVVSKFASFAVSAGIVRYNYFLLPIFTFIRKCCGVPEEVLDEMLNRHAIRSMVFSSQSRAVTPLTPPPRVATAVVQHLQGPESTASRHSHGGRSAGQSMATRRSVSSASRPRSQASHIALMDMDLAASSALHDVQVLLKDTNTADG